MTARVKVTALARFDIAQQANYYRTVAPLAVAQRWRKAANEAIRTLRLFPERGSLLRSERPELKGLRWIGLNGFPSHLVLYRFDAARNTVFIEQFVHGAKDFK